MVGEEKLRRSASFDPEFKWEVSARPGGEHLKTCFACGVCTAGCPVAEIDPAYNPRRIIRMVILGMRQQVLSSEMIWLCSTCYTCYAHCPQDVRFTEIMKVLREMAVEEGYVHSSFLECISRVDRLSESLRRQMLMEILPHRGEGVEIEERDLLTRALRNLEDR